MGYYDHRCDQCAGLLGLLRSQACSRYAMRFAVKSFVIPQRHPVSSDSSLCGLLQDNAERVSERGS